MEFSSRFGRKFPLRKQKIEILKEGRPGGAFVLSSNAASPNVVNSQLFHQFCSNDSKVFLQ
jgi:hypothetical protein